MSSVLVKPGQASVARTTVLIIMMVDAALGQLKDLGYERGFDDIKIIDNEEGFPCVELDGQTIFEVFFEADPSRGLAIKGDWRAPLPKKKRFLWLLRSYRWVIRRLTSARAS